MRNLASFTTSITFEPPAFKNVARYTNGETTFLHRNDRPMSLPSLVKLGPRTPENPLSESTRRKRAKSSIARFLSNFVQSLNA